MMGKKKQNDKFFKVSIIIINQKERWGYCADEYRTFKNKSPRHLFLSY